MTQSENLQYNGSNKLVSWIWSTRTINNYWTRLSKISWFVCGEQINYLPKPKAEANNWSARHWQITIFAITEFNNCFIIRSPSLFFVWISLGSGVICHFHARAIARRRKERFPLRMSRILFAAKHFSQTLLDGVAPEQTVICRKLFAVHVVGSRPMKRKKNLLQMII